MLTSEFLVPLFLTVEETGFGFYPNISGEVPIQIFPERMLIHVIITLFFKNIVYIIHTYIMHSFLLSGMYTALSECW